MSSRAEQSPSPFDKAWHALSIVDVCTYWETDPRAGLDEATAAERVRRVGPNALPDAPKPHPLARFFSQFTNPLVGALLAAAVIATLVAATDTSARSTLARFGDAIAILIIVILNAVLGFVQEYQAERSLDALRKLAAPTTRLRRDGQSHVVPAAELVPGDVVELEAGDAIPADLRLLSATDLATEEAALTGESTPVEKDAARTLEAGASLGDRANMAFMGTTTSRGRAVGIVVQTGAHTELGRIDAMIRATKHESTPLEQRLAKLGTIILIVCGAVSAALFVLGLVQQHQPWTVLLLTAVSLAVAAIPEGLPAVTTITLALGMQRMAKRGALVRKLPAVETLGSASVICSDKTGTLTQNQMTVRTVQTLDEVWTVTGEGYGRQGSFLFDGAARAPTDTLRQLMCTAVLCNSASLRTHPDGTVTPVGDPTEAALLALASKAGIFRDPDLEIEAEIPFDSDRKRMSMVVREPTGLRHEHVKGSPDGLIPRCRFARTRNGLIPLTEANRAELQSANESLASRALRVLAIADRENPEGAAEAELVFLGLAGMMDPPRVDVAAAIEECRQAGIRVVMITGDHRATAVAIARELGLWTPNALALTGEELDKTDDQKLATEIERVTVFARVTAEQKLRIVKAIKATGAVVAMTGDGVNDAPALKEAQIGVAMGRTGSDVAREASDMVLADDNFATIVHAVREGRAIFRDIQKFIFFLNSSNAGLVLAVIVGSFFAWMPQLTPLQLLWINLVTNGLPALALGVDPPEPGQMQEPPRRRTEGIVGKRDAYGMAVVGVVMAGAGLVCYWMPGFWPDIFRSAVHEQQLEEARTMAFTVLALSPLFHAFNARSPTASILTLGVFTNRVLWIAILVSGGLQLATLLTPALHSVFRTHALTAAQWALVVSLAALPVPVIEGLKWRKRRQAMV